MRVGGKDAEFMETEFAPVFTPEDLVNLAKYQMYLKLMVDGVATSPFSANSLSPIANLTGTNDRVIAVSRERYAEPRQVIEEKVLKWAGMETVEMTAQQAPAGTGEEGTPAAPEATLHPDGGTTEPSVQYPAILTEDEREAQAPEASAERAEYLTIRPDRLAALTAGQPAKKTKPQFPHTCTRCGKVWNLPLQLDPTRPMYCAECRPLVLEERNQRSSTLKKMLKAPVPTEPSAMAVSELTEPNTQPFQANRPRIIRSPDGPGMPAKPENLFEEALRSKGGRVEMHKKTLEKRAGGPGPVQSGDDEHRSRRKRKRSKGGGQREETHHPTIIASRAPSESLDLDLDTPTPIQTRTPGEREKPTVVFKPTLSSVSATPPTHLNPGQRVRFDE